MGKQFTDRGKPSVPCALPCGTESHSPYQIRLRWGHCLGENDIQYLSLGARAAQGVEKRYRDEFRRKIFRYIEQALSELSQGCFDPNHYQFEPLIIDHAIASMKAGLKRPKSIPVRMAANPLPRIFRMWDEWRKGKRVPVRQQKNVKDIKSVFLHTVQTFWQKYSEDFREGSVYNLDEAKQALASRAKIVVNRANMIVNTETTVYFNKARTDFYAQAEGVTHMLFVAIRDKRTTKWCTDFHKGGRDGLVYPKDSATTKKETPACHWNCRSEMLPLSPSNPVHLKLIRDARRARGNNTPTPLPRGWNGR